MNSPTLVSAGLLVLRVVIGVTFLLHGIDKFTNATYWEHYFAAIDIPAPALMSPVIGVTETAGGVLLIAGLGTPLVGVALAIDMFVALVTAHISHGFFVDRGGFELVLLLGSASFAFVLTGPGRFSVDSAIDLTRRLPRDWHWLVGQRGAQSES